jgi:hypothetical protein
MLAVPIFQKLPNAGWRGIRGDKPEGKREDTLRLAYHLRRPVSSVFPSFILELKTSGWIDGKKWILSFGPDAEVPGT